VKKQYGLILIALTLVLISVCVYIAHYLIFHDIHHILIYMMGDLAFLPLEVLLVGIVVERILTRREIEEKKSKLNMVISAFYSEVGNPLVAMLLNATSQRGLIVENLDVTSTWKEAEFKKAKLFVKNTGLIDFDQINISELHAFLLSKRGFLLSLIDNPNVLEHELFSDVLLSVFHLAEELESRPSLTNLGERDRAHITEDIKRANRNLLVQWLDYMKHLKSNYPYLFSHYLRIHPFQYKPSAVIE
jgi:hypothetical protein